VSILEPYAGNSVGIPLVPSKPHYPKFPHLGSCAWSMNQKIHVFCMIMNWFQVVPKAFMAWLWLSLVLDRIGWRRKEIQLAEASQFFVMSPQLYVKWEMMKMNLGRKGLTPTKHMSLFWFDWTSWNWWWWAPAVRLCWDLTGQLTWASAAGICIWVGLAQLDFVVELIWAWSSLQKWMVLP